MEIFHNKLRGLKEGWLKKTAGLRRLSRKNEIIGRAIAANKAFFFHDMLMMMDRGGIEALGVGDNSGNPLYHDAEKSEYISRIIYANKAALLNGEIPDRVSRRNQKGTILYPPFGEHTNAAKENQEDLLAGM